MLLFSRRIFHLAQSLCYMTEVIMPTSPLEVINHTQYVDWGINQDFQHGRMMATLQGQMSYFCPARLISVKARHSNMPLYAGQSTIYIILNRAPGDVPSSPLLTVPFELRQSHDGPVIAVAGGASWSAEERVQ